MKAKVMWQILILASLVSYSEPAENIDWLDEIYATDFAELYNSFTKFKDGVKKFFHLKELEKRRKIVKIAIKNFIKDVTKDNLLERLEEEEPITTMIPKGDHILRKADNTEVSPFKQSVQDDGYRAESHVVVTKDGFVLTLHRIVPSVMNAPFGENGVVLLHHGLLGSSDDWIILGPKRALPYLLLDAKYDVWLLNARGNKYSKAHVNNTLNLSDVWNFSWHEIGLIDLAAAINYIKKKHKKKVQLYFIGHSMGATALLVLLSILPKYNHVFKIAVLLAPLVFMEDVKGPLQFLAQFYKKLTLDTTDFLEVHKFFGVHEFMPPQKLSTIFFEHCEGDEELCENPLLLLTNGVQAISDVKLKNKIMEHTPSGGSMKTIIHYIQLVKSGLFQRFDMGSKQNLKTYGEISPPNYLLKNVKLPVAVFSSSDDWLSTRADVKKLLTNLSKPVLHHVVRSDDFSHTDFLWSENAHILVYYLILDYLNQTKLTL